MHYFKIILAATTIFFISNFSNLIAQDSTRINNQTSTIQHGQHFIDEDGDGYNDNAPDHDHDGIPNGLDPDWKKEQAQKGKRHRWKYIDLDGDGINDNMQTEEQTDNQENNFGGEQNNKGSSIGNQEDSGGNKQRKRKGPNK